MRIDTASDDCIGADGTPGMGDGADAGVALDVDAAIAAAAVVVVVNTERDAGCWSSEIRLAGLVGNEDCGGVSVGSVVVR